jgi:hypothetical protein
VSASNPGIHRNNAASREARRFHLRNQDDVDSPHDLSVSSVPLWVDRELWFLILTFMSDDTEILQEICDLLRLIAEPALVKRDERLRASLQELVGKSKQKAEVVVLMDGTRSQADIRKAAGIDPGNFSRLITALREAELIGPDEKRPKLVLSVPLNLIDNVGDAKK